MMLLHSDRIKFLIIGASGFIGRHLLAHVKALGFQLLGTEGHSRQEGLVTFDLIRDRIGDCVSRSFFDGEEQVHAVICSVISDMDRCVTEPDMSYLVNVQNTIRLIDDLRVLKARPVFLSTSFVFGGREGYYTEDQPCSPANEYGRHKAEVEHYLRAHVSEAFIARLNKVVGSNPREHHLFSEFYKLIAQDQPIVCIEGLLISPTYVRDVVRAIVLACQKGMAGVYHIANSEFFTRDELARQFCYALGITPNVVCKPLKEFGFKDNRGLKSYLDGSKFVRATAIRYTSMREVFADFTRQLTN